MSPSACPSTRILVVNVEPAVLAAYLLALAHTPVSAESAAILRVLTRRPRINLVRALGVTVEPSPPKYELSTCSGAETAVRAVREGLAAARPFGVVFVDANLPLGPDGIWVAERIRALDPDIEIVLLLDHSDIDRVEINRRVPPRNKLFYFVKPFQPLLSEARCPSSRNPWALEPQDQGFQHSHPRPFRGG